MPIIKGRYFAMGFFTHLKDIGITVCVHVSFRIHNTG